MLLPPLAAIRRAELLPRPAVLGLSVAVAMVEQRMPASKTMVAQFVKYVEYGMSPRMFIHSTEPDTETQAHTNTQKHTLTHTPHTHTHTPHTPQLHLYENVLPLLLCCSATERFPLDTLYHSIRSLSPSLSFYLSLSLSSISVHLLCLYIIHNAFIEHKYPICTRFVLSLCVVLARSTFPPWHLLV